MAKFQSRLDEESPCFTVDQIIRNLSGSQFPQGRTTTFQVYDWDPQKKVWYRGVLTLQPQGSIFRLLWLEVQNPDQGWARHLWQQVQQTLKHYNRTLNVVF